MKPIDSGYLIAPKSICEKYIQDKGGSLKDVNWKYSIQSHAALVYTLANGEVVMIPSHSAPDYPSFIFKNIESFDKLGKQDYFPIDKRYMTWLEANADSVAKIDEASLFYRLPLQKAFGTKFPLQTREEIRELFDKVLTYARSKNNSEVEKKEIVYCFGLSVIMYLKNVKGYKIQMDKFYEIYNPYFQPLIIYPDGRKSNIFDQLFMSIRSNLGNIFELFERRARL